VICSKCGLPCKNKCRLKWFCIVKAREGHCKINKNYAFEKGNWYMNKYFDFYLMPGSWLCTGCSGCHWVVIRDTLSVSTASANLCWENGINQLEKAQIVIEEENPHWHFSTWQCEWHCAFNLFSLYSFNQI
jgi:hypothetical protein